jgi:hypothetical protein
MTDNQTDDQRPPKPHPDAQWVPDVPLPDGKVRHAHWRMPKGQGVKTHKSKRRKPGPKPGKPRNTTSMHAVFLWERLAVPIALLNGIAIGNLWPRDGKLNTSVQEALKAIEEARDFVNRFTSGTNAG